MKNRAAWWLVVVLSVVVLGGTGVLLYWNWHSSPAYLQNSLVNAAGRGDVDAVRALLARGAKANSPDRFGIKALWAAADFSPFDRTKEPLYAAVVRLLIAHGANPNERTKAGLTPLWEAAQSGDTPEVEAFLDGGADPNARDNVMGMTALMWAGRKRQTAMVQSLIAHGADVNAKSKGGMTVLMHAASGGSPPVVQLLLAHGAEVKAREHEKGYTALTFAKIHGHPQVMLLLKQADAKQPRTPSAGLRASIRSDATP
jgi:ankyrin repeat protein